MMLNHIGQNDVAARVHNAWLKTIEDGIHTYDIFKEGVSKQKVGTKEFAQAVIANLDSNPSQLKPVTYETGVEMNLPKVTRKPLRKKELLGVDVFVHWPGTNPDEIAAILQKMETDRMKLSMITNRGIKVWPEGFEETFCTDHWRCRFKNRNGGTIEKSDIVNLLSNAIDQQIDTIKTENLYAFDAVQAFSLGKGQ